MSAHTPGPWLVLTNGCGRGHIGTFDGVNSEGDPMYWTTASVNTRRDEWEANSHLIAAAPEMLDALEVVSMSRGWNNMSEQLQALIKLAIAKATQP